MRVGLAFFWVGLVLVSGEGAAQRNAPRLTGKVAPSKPHAIPPTGTLGEKDLAELGRLGSNSASDQFSDNPTLAYVGRDYSIVLPTSEVSVDYDREAHMLSAVVAKYTNCVMLDQQTTSSTYAGQNAFGAKAAVAKLRGKSFGIWLPGSIYARGPLTYKAAIDGEAARALSSAIRPRLSGKIIKADGVYAEKASAIMKKSLITDASVASPMDTWVEQFCVAVSVDKIEWIDGRTGQPVPGASDGPVAKM